MAEAGEMKKVDYDEIRPLIQCGDVIAFGGEGLVSKIIKLATSSVVSHVGVVRQTALAHNMWQNHVIESTSLNGMSGVTTNRLSQRLQDYRGEVWWLPLSTPFRATISWSTFFLWLEHQHGKRYDTLAAIDSALDWGERLPLIGHWFRNPEKYKRLFCSQLVTGAFKQAGGLPDYINPAEMTPKDLVSMQIYGEARQLKGSLTAIKGFNSRPLSSYK